MLQTHARFWNDQEHARFTTAHGQEDKWVVGGIHYEHPIPKLRRVDIVCTFKGMTHRIDNEGWLARFSLHHAADGGCVGY
jgi:hypothetical protein